PASSKTVLARRRPPHGATSRHIKLHRRDKTRLMRAGDVWRGVRRFAVFQTTRLEPLPTPCGGTEEERQRRRFLVAGMLRDTMPTSSPPSTPPTRILLARH